MDNNTKCKTQTEEKGITIVKCPWHRQDVIIGNSLRKQNTVLTKED